MRSRRLGSFLLCAFLFAWGLGFFGLGGFRNPALLTILDRAYHALQLFVLQSPPATTPMTWGLHIARFLAPLVAYSSLVAAVLWLARNRFRLYRARWQRNHCVICGIGQKGTHLAGALAEAGYDVVGLDVREEHLHADSLEERGVILLQGDARDPVVLRNAGVHRARFLVALTGADNTNLEVAIAAYDLLGESRGGRSRRHPLRCIAHVRSPQLCRLIKEYELKQARGSGLRIEFFDVASNAARCITNRHPPFTPDMAENGESPLVVIVGAGPVARMILITAARSWAMEASTSSSRIRFELYDEGVKRQFEALSNAFPHLTSCAEVEVCEIDREIPSFSTINLPPDLPSIVYVCLGDDALTLAAALALHRHYRAAEFPIVACMMEDAGVASLLNAGDALVSDSRPLTLEGLNGFAVLAETCTSDLVTGSLGRQIHEHWLRTSLGRGEQLASKPTLVPWKQLDEETREDNRRQADHIYTKLRAIGCGIVPEDDWRRPLFEFDTGEIERLARMEHERWMDARLTAGWRRGPRNDAKRTHPDLVPWTQLDEPARDKDRDTVRRIPQLLRSVGLAIYRPDSGSRV